MRLSTQSQSLFLNIFETLIDLKDVSEAMIFSPFRSVSISLFSGITVLSVEKIIDYKEILIFSTILII